MTNREAGVVAIMGGLLALVALASLYVYVDRKSSGRAKPTNNVVKCSSNLLQVGQAYQVYVRDFRAPPPDLAALIETQDLGFEAFCCPLTDTAPPGPNVPLPQQVALARAKPLTHIGYEYIYRSTPAGPDEIIAYDRLDNHAGHLSIPSDINVVFGNGRVEKWKVADVKKKLAELGK
jgi:hypothetical protein